MICEKCPFKASIDVANELINEVVNLDKNRALGGIAITLRALELASEKLDCTGSTNSQSGDKECPLKSTVLQARAFATSPWSQAAFVADLDKGLIKNEGNDEQTSHGNYI